MTQHTKLSASDTDSALLPIFRKDGTVVAHARVDPDVLVWASEHKWFQTSEGYIARSHRLPDGSLETLLLHRQVLKLEPYGVPRVRFVSRDRLDVRRQNLRISTRWITDAIRNDPDLVNVVMRRVPQATLVGAA